MKSQEILEHQLSLIEMHQSNIDRLTKEIESETNEMIKNISRIQLRLAKYMKDNIKIE